MYHHTHNNTDANFVLSSSIFWALVELRCRRRPRSMLPPPQSTHSSHSSSSSVSVNKKIRLAKQRCPACPPPAKQACPREKSVVRKTFSSRTCTQQTQHACRLSRLLNRLWWGHQHTLRRTETSSGRRGGEDQHTLVRGVCWVCGCGWRAATSSRAGGEAAPRARRPPAGAWCFYLSQPNFSRPVKALAHPCRISVAKPVRNAAVKLS